ncbi:MAG: S49 family peptidase [Elusimicrobiota bacterium]|jgi:ClpP class serine protease|nr:S49 family peptidase [Elusimicrobiota bacterium]
MDNFEVLAIEENWYFKVNNLKKNFLKNNQIKDIEYKNKTDDDTIYYRFDNIGYIKILGELVVKKDFFAEFFGYKQTSYSEIIEAIDILDREKLEKIVFLFDSPGGVVSGILEVMQKINHVTTPTESIVLNQCCSGAYFLASQTQEIIANNELSSVGSVGVIASFIDDTKMMENIGLQEIIITSTDAPEKYIDISKEKGQQTIKERLDKVHDILVRYLTNGRNVSVDYVNENFGKGGVLFAREALEVGMIDEMGFYISAKHSNNARINTKNKIKESKIMNLEELRSQHQDLYVEVVNLGRQEERERIMNFLEILKLNPQALSQICDYIASGKEEKEVRAELRKAIYSASPEPILQAKTNSHQQQEQNTEKIDVDVKGIAEKVKSIVF